MTANRGRRSGSLWGVKLRLVAIICTGGVHLMSPEKTLDRLISVSLDSQKRYHHAALDVGKEYLARFFNQQADTRKRHADVLQGERNKLGADKDGSGSVAGALNTAAMDFNV